MPNSINPFRPGAGRVPPELAGRAQLLGDFTRLMYEARETGEGHRPWVLSGLRGVGKTALLNQLGREAEALKIIFIKLEASAAIPLTAGLAKELHLSLRRVMSTSDRARHVWSRAAGALKSFQMRFDPDGSYAIGISAQPLAGVADSGDLSVDLLELLENIGEAARDANSVLLIGIDELQEAPTRDLTALNMALHSLGQAPRPVPIMFVGVGLPSLPAVLADATSYAERLYDYRHIGLLDDDATRSALEIPANAAGVSWQPLALESAVRHTGGYPYFVQALGSHIWVARTSDLIDADDVELGTRLATAEVDSGLYQSRWERATPKQRALLIAMAQDDGKDSPVAMLSERLGKKRSSLSVTRDQLIKNGLIYAPSRGFLAFTVPGMPQFIERQAG